VLTISTACVHSAHPGCLCLAQFGLVLVFVLETAANQGARGPGSRPPQANFAGSGGLDIRFKGRYEDRNLGFQSRLSGHPYQSSRSNDLMRHCCGSDVINRLSVVFPLYCICLG
jgi:hypothetical protein